MAMKKLIVGLGNPGKEYVRTRHNAGFLCLDAIHSALDFPDWKFNKTLNAEISKRDNIIFLKPQTFMNESGLSVTKALAYFDVSPEHLVVIHDETDLLHNTYKIQENRGAAGHNGVKSINERLKNDAYKRVRIGVRPSHLERVKAGDFVLTPFSTQELKELRALFPAIQAALGL